MQSIIFDPNSDAITPDGYTIIDTEMEFLKYATSGKSLFIRGHRLCDWAQAFFDSRRISYSEISSPAKRLKENFIEPLVLKHKNPIFSYIKNIKTNESE